MLTGCVFFVRADVSDVALAKRLIRAHGGSYAYLVSPRVTHVLVANVQDARGDLQVDKAMTYNAAVVRWAFLTESIKAGRRLPEEAFVAIKGAHMLAQVARERPASITLFVSSTFVDMCSERVALASRVLPSLAALCEDRGVLLQTIDLRWGVDSSTPLVTCLNLVAGANYFVAALGERYGYIPDSASVAAARAAFPGLHIPDGCSITEIEVRLFAHLQAQPHTQQLRHSLFLLRDARYRPPGCRPEDVPLYTCEAVDKSRAFKAWVRDTQQRVLEYGSDEQFEERVAHELTAMVERDCPPLQPGGGDDGGVSELNKHIQRQAAFARTRASTSVSPVVRRALDMHLRTQPTTPLVLFSEVAGAGLSTALASFVASSRRAGAATASGTEPIWLTHFTGGPVEHAVRFWLLELQQLFSWHQLDVPAEDAPLSALLQVLLAWLRAITALQRNVVLVLDGLQDLGGAVRSLCSLPALPKGAVLIMALSQRVELADAMRKCWKDDCIVTVPRMAPAECVEFCVAHLGRYGKQLSASQRDTIAACPEPHRLALHLVLAMEFVRAFATYETVDADLKLAVVESTIEQLMALLLDKWEAAFGRAVVQCVCSAAVSARHGLTLLELRHVAGRHDNWRAFLAAACKVLTDKGSGVAPFHVAFAQVCTARYGTCHDDLYDTYEEMHNATEMCYQAWAAQSKDRLRAALFQPDVTIALGADDAHRYWSVIETMKAPGLLALLRKCTSAVQEARLAGALGQMLARRGNFASAARLLEEACRLAPGLGLSHEVTTRLQYGHCLLELGDSDRALAVATEVVQLCGGGSSDAFVTWEALSFHSLVLKKRSAFGEALDYCRRAYAAAARVHSENHPVLGTLLCDEADLLRKAGWLAGAQTAYARAQSVLELSFGLEHPALLPCLRGNALCAKKRGQYTETSRLIQQCLRFVEPQHPLRAKLMGDLADAQRKLEDYHAAIDTYTAALQLLQATAGLEVMEAGELYHGIALVQKKLGAYEAAEAAERSALAIVERLHGKLHYKYGIWLSALADVVRKRGQVQAALALYREARVALRGTLEETHDEVQMVDMSIGLCLKVKLALYDEASVLYDGVIRNLTAVFGEGHYKVAMALSQQADVLRKRKESDRALAMYSKAEAILLSCVGPNNSEMTDVLLGKAVLLTASGRFLDARLALERGLDVVQRLFGLSHYKKALFVARLGENSQAQGDVANARFQYQAALNVLEVALGPTHVEVADVLVNLASVERGATQRQLLERALQIVVHELGGSHPKAKQINALLQKCALGE